MGIRERLQARDAQFISFADLLTEVAKAENVTKQEAAIGLSHANAFSGVTTRLRMHGYGEIDVGGEDALAYEIDCAVHGQQTPFRSYAAQWELDCGEVGFLCAEIAPALASARIAVPERLRGWLPQCADSEATTNERSTPEPERTHPVTYISRQWIALGAAADLLASCNESTHYEEWMDALTDAADSRQIESGTWGAYRSDQPLLHADIRNWCAAYGYTWPVPLPESRPQKDVAVDTETALELDRACARIAELERERDGLLKRIEATTKTAEAAAINSPTLCRILGAVADYPAWRAAQKQEPNLKAVLGWQEKQQNGKGNASRVAHVAHHVIAEHFGLKP